MTDDFDFINGVSGRICNLTGCKFKNPAVYFFDALAARGVARLGQYLHAMRQCQRKM